MEIQNRAGESRILLVEDDKEIREGIEIFLRGQGSAYFRRPTEWKDLRYLRGRRSIWQLLIS